MVLKNLALTDFRNYKSVSVPFYDGINVIYGANAGGKTNLLEAVFCFAAGKSFRGCKDRELIRFGAESASASITFESGGVDNSFRILLVRGAKKQAFGISRSFPRRGLYPRPSRPDKGRSGGQAEVYRHGDMPVVPPVRCGAERIRKTASAE